MEERPEIIMKRLVVLQNRDAADNNVVDFWRRCTSGLLMILAFILIISMGPIPIVILIFAIQLLVFREVISVAHQKSVERRIPWFRTTTWYVRLVIHRIFLTGTLVFLYGEGLLNHGREFAVLSMSITKSFVRSIAFLFYIFGLVCFVLNLKEGHYKFQFSQLSLTVMSLLFIIVQSHFVVKNIREGLIWFVVPTLLVITNDITAYLIGKSIGRIKLLKISPKKTLEGYLGGLFATVLLSIYVRSRFFFVGDTETVRCQVSGMPGQGINQCTDFF